MMLCSCVRQRQLLQPQAGQPRLTHNMRAKLIFQDGSGSGSELWIHIESLDPDQGVKIAVNFENLAKFKHQKKCLNIFFIIFS
jgi:hypothetical protein